MLGVILTVGNSVGSIGRLIDVGVELGVTLVIGDDVVGSSLGYVELLGESLKATLGAVEPVGDMVNESLAISCRIKSELTVAVA